MLIKNLGRSQSSATTAVGSASWPCVRASVERECSDTPLIAVKPEWLVKQQTLQKHLNRVKNEKCLMIGGYDNHWVFRLFCVLLHPTCKNTPHTYGLEVCCLVALYHRSILYFYCFIQFYYYFYSFFIISYIVI